MRRYICIMVQLNKRPPETNPCGPCCEDVRGLMEIRFFRALGDANRVTILADLAASGASRTVSEIAERLPVDLSVVSRHLAMLREAGVLAAERRGKEVYYTVRYQALAGTLRAIADTIDACCPGTGATNEDDTHG